MKRLAALVVVLASLTGCAGSRDVQADRVQHLEIEVNGSARRCAPSRHQVEDLYDRLTRSKVLRWDQVREAPFFISVAPPSSTSRGR
jgi:hypothetical protein